jgi:hypothetical protein
VEVAAVADVKLGASLIPIFVLAFVHGTISIVGE